ncbi:MAG: lysophospholipid acyltransferase family protein [Tenuifilaceae bacterium]|nr:lysophospholipid acyltransferase family protein [Tenuifilaceae bacterium]
MKYILNFITAAAFFVGIVLIGIMPFRVMYWFSDFFAFMLRRVFGYRSKTIDENLARAYPNLPVEEKQRLTKLIYRNISDVFIEGVKAFLMTHQQVVRRHKVINPEILEPYLKSGQSIIGLTGHIANWEWGSLSASGQINTSVVAFYKELSNPLIDKFVKASRRKYGTILASTKFTSETFEEHKDKKTIFVMAADQSPTKKQLEQAYWANFFEQNTPFLYGPEKYSHLHNLPIFFIDIYRVKRGYYEVELSLLADNPASLPSGSVTDIYAQKLVEVINRKPADWLWSHRRWRFAKTVEE